MSKKRTTPPIGNSVPVGSRGKLETMVKWVGAVTAIISLILGMYQVTKLVSDVRERKRQIDEIYAMGKAQQANADYQAAWNSFTQGLKSADEGGQLAKLTGDLDAQRKKLREAQEDLAMLWLQNIRVTSDQKFTDIIDQLMPTLNRGLASANGARKADLLAHIGWAYFLKRRDGPSGMDPAQQYRLALEIDPSNPYAQANLGHWIIWQRGNLNEASNYFASAIASGRDRVYARKMQLAALRNFRSKQSEGEFLRVVNDMRKNNEKIDDRVRNDVHSIIYFALNSLETFQALTAALPAAEQIDMIRSLFYRADFDESKISTRESYMAMLQEAAGQPDEALKTWRAMRSGIAVDSKGTPALRADAAIRRLTK